MIFAINLGDSADISVEAEDSQQVRRDLDIEYIGAVPDLYWLIQIVVKLSDLTGNQDVLLRLKLGESTSPSARIRLK